MNEKEFKAKIKEGRIEEVKTKNIKEEKETSKRGLEGYGSLLKGLRWRIRGGDSVPTYTPKSFLECFYAYENAGTYRLYVYIKDAWHNASA